MAEAIDSAARGEKIAELKRQIAVGGYETPEKLAAAVEALLADCAPEHATPDYDRPRHAK